MLSLRRKLVIFVTMLLLLTLFIDENISNDITTKWIQVRKDLYQRINISSLSSLNESDPRTVLEEEDIFIPPVFIKNISTNSANNVFLLETGSHEDFSPKFRLLSSVESWSRSNPDLQVWFLVKCNRILDEDGLLRKLLNHYPNLRIALLNPYAVLENTPIIGVFNGEFRKGKFEATHLSDFLRFALLWKFGGFYSDTDTVCIRSVSHLHNVVGLTNDRLINSAVCHFDKAQALPWTIMKKVLNTYSADDYFSVIRAVGQNIREACGISKKQDLKFLPNSTRCKGVNIMPSEAFFPLNGRGDSKLYFEHNKADGFNKTFESSYVLHMAASWNTKKEVDTSVRIGVRTLYEKAVELYSPVTYRAILARNIVF